MPKVSIGLPVYNGERYIAQAIESILSQTFKDFELILCDNASADCTENICRDYARHDSRVKYYRSSLNIGAAANFNKSFKLATSEYFKWASHDDLISKDFLGRCVKILDEDKGAVLSYTKTAIIDANCNIIEPYEIKLPTDSPNPELRFVARVEGHKCHEIYGLIRSSLLKKMPLIGSYVHGDGVLLARLALLGRFEEIPEYLFFRRMHPEQSVTMAGDHRQWAVWFEPKLRGKMTFPYWRIFFEHMKSLHMFPINWKIRLQCYRYLIYWMYMRRSRLRENLTFYIRQSIRRSFDIEK